MYKYEDIRTVHLEITAKCQAACLQCDRNVNGGEINPNISLDEFWKISNSFRGPMWIKDKDDNWYNKYWDELKN